MTWNFEVTGFLKYYFRAEVGKLWHMGQSQPATWYICISPSAFLSLKGEKNQRPILQAVWKRYEIQVSLSINKTLLEHKKKIQAVFSNPSLRISKEDDDSFVEMEGTALMLVLKSKSCSWCFRSHIRDHILSHLPMQEVRVQSLGQEDPLKKEMTTHSILAWEIPWTEEPGRL